MIQRSADLLTYECPFPSMRVIANHKIEIDGLDYGDGIKIRNDQSF